MACCGISIKTLMDKIEGDDINKITTGRFPKLTANKALQIDEKEEAEFAERTARLWIERKLKPSEVVIHNTVDDCWVSWNGIVRDLTPVLAQWKGTPMADVILSEAGKDISHWFDKNGNLRSSVSDLTGIRIPYLPRGEVPQTTAEVYPSALYPVYESTYWWKEDSYIVGHLTSNTRLIAITNVLAVTTAYITVCEEDTLGVILIRYLMFNANSKNYTWKYDKTKLDMSKTLAENNVPDFAKHFKKIGLPEDQYIPNLFLFFNDNL